METIYTIIDKVKGRELRCQFNIENVSINEIAIINLRTEELENPHFNFETKEFYNIENAK